MKCSRLWRGGRFVEDRRESDVGLRPGTIDSGCGGPLTGLSFRGHAVHGTPRLGGRETADHASAVGDEQLVIGDGRCRSELAADFVIPFLNTIGK